jgi:hypothetical protein
MTSSTDKKEGNADESVFSAEFALQSSIFTANLYASAGSSDPRDRNSCLKIRSSAYAGDFSFS